MVINLERSYVLVMVQAGVLISRLGVSVAPFVVAPFLARVFFFFFFFISNLYPGPIFRFCIKYRSSGRPSIYMICFYSYFYLDGGVNIMILHIDEYG